MEHSQHSISRFIFNVCLVFAILAYGLILLGNVWYVGNNLFPSIGLTIILFVTIPLFISSVFVLWKDRKHWVLPVIGILLSLLSFAMVIGIAIAIKNFT